MKNILKILVLSALVLSSCQKGDDIRSTSTGSEAILKSAQIAVNDIAMETAFEELNYDADFFAESEHLLRQLVRLRGGRHLLAGGHCGRYDIDMFPDVSVDTSETDTGYPVTITIDYGDSTVLHHGSVVSGIVTIELSAPKNTDGASRTITFTDCMIDSVQINGTSTETFEGDNVTTRQFTSSMDISFVLADTLTLERKGTHVRTWLSGLDTPLEHADDTLQITGSDEISSSSGDNWSRMVTEPLIKTGTCRHFISGTVQFTMNGELIGELDFGDGDCDNLAVLTANGEEIEIELQYHLPRAGTGEQHRNRGRHGRGH